MRGGGPDDGKVYPGDASKVVLLAMILAAKATGQGITGSARQYLWQAIGLEVVAEALLC